MANAEREDDGDHSSNRRSGARHLEKPWTPLQRLVGRFAYGVIGACAIAVAAGGLSFVRGYWSLPMKVEELKAQQSVFDRRQTRDSARTDSIYRVQAGMVAVLCFGLSDEAFEKAKSLCGEAFYVSRVISDERVQRKTP